MRLLLPIVVWLALALGATSAAGDLLGRWRTSGHDPMATWVPPPPPSNERFLVRRTVIPESQPQIAALPQR